MSRYDARDFCSQRKLLTEIRDSFRAVFYLENFVTMPKLRQRSVNPESLKFFSVAISLCHTFGKGCRDASFEPVSFAFWPESRRRGHTRDALYMFLAGEESKRVF